MAKYTGPACRQCRREGVKLFSKGERCYTEKCALNRRTGAPHLHSESLKLGSFSFKASDSIVIGNEGHGVSDKTVSICDGSVIIPMVEGAESLNAATASSIIIWEMNKAKLY